MLINVNFFRCVVGFYGARLDDYGAVSVLVGLAASRHRPRHVTTHQDHPAQNDGHN